MFNYSKKIILIIATITMLSLIQGCAGNVKMSPQDRAELEKLDKIIVVSQNPGWPTMMTPLGVLASNLTFGLSEDWSAGQKLVTKFKTKNPNQLIKEKFLKNINKKPKITNFDNVKETISHEDSSIENLKQTYKDGAVLKFSRRMWTVGYFMTNWTRYLMLFSANAELIRLSDSKVIWSSYCIANQDDEKTAPTLDQLTADGNTSFIEWIDNATSECAKQFTHAFHE